MKKFIFLAAILGLTSLKMFAQNIASEDATKYIGKTVTVCGKIFGGRLFFRQLSILSIGGIVITTVRNRFRRPAA